MEEANGHIDELIVSFLSKELGREGMEELKAWIAASEENRAYFMRCQALWFSASQEEEAACYDVEKAYRKFCDRVNARRERFSIGRQGRTWRIWVRYAAVVVLAGMIACFSYWQGKNEWRDALGSIEVQAPLGSQTRICLPDGTWVVLNAGSRMVYGQDFGMDGREVFLEGEGYFEVAHNAESPFRVCSGNLQVRVLGTKFNFRDYPEDRNAVVSLVEGKVALGNKIRKEPEQFLMPDERIVLDKSDGRLEKERVEQIAADVDWRNGMLSFDEVLLSEVIKVLERSYDVQIELATDSLAAYRFYGNFSCVEQSIKDVLEALAATGKVNYTLKGRNAVLY